MKTPIGYYGGKQNMVKYILPSIPEHDIYVEPFFGGGAVYFAKQPSRVEVINDRDSRVYNFWKVTVERFDELKEMIDLTLHSREIHKQAKIWLDSDDPVRKAWAFWYQTNGSFEKGIKNGFAYSKNTALWYCKNRKFDFSKAIFERLENCYIENLDALDLIGRWDSPETFYYFDPPYFNSDMGHYGGYTENDYENLLRSISELAGKFLLSSYPSEILDRYIEANDWKYRDIEMHLSAPLDNAGKKKIERLVWNYEIDKGLFD